VQAAGNHQMQNQPEVAFYSMAIRLPIRRSWVTGRPSTSEIGVRGSKQKETGQSHALDWLREDARLKCADVGGDVGKFRHEYELCRLHARFCNIVQARWTKFR